MSKVNYSKLKIQNYLKDSKTSRETANVIFKHIIFMLNFKENFRGSSKNDNCHLCDEHLDCQDEIKSCKVLSRKFNKLDKCKTIYGKDPKN